MSLGDLAGVIGAITALAGLLGSTFGYLLRGLREVKRLEDKYVSREDMLAMEARHVSAIKDLTFMLDRHIEHSTALWVNREEKD